MNNTVIISAYRWHEICNRLNLDEWGGANDRKTAFEECFNCTVTWRSGLHEWGGVSGFRPNPTMALRFLNPTDATIFALKWS